MRQSWARTFGFSRGICTSFHAKFCTSKEFINKPTTVPHRCRAYPSSRLAGWSLDGAQTGIQRPPSATAGKNWNPFFNHAFQLFTKMMKNYITKLTPSKSCIRLIFLFQSQRQTLSWFFTFTLTFIVIYIASDIFDFKKMPVHIMFSSALLGSIFSLVFSLPFQFQVKFYRSDIQSIIYKHIEFSGYRLAHTNANNNCRSIFEQRGPKWLSWRESDIIIENTMGWLKINGPFLMLWKVRAALTKII